eukprot:11649428-Ditylum_brightwellii.AAC.1
MYEDTQDERKIDKETKIEEILPLVWKHCDGQTALDVLMDQYRRHRCHFGEGSSNNGKEGKNFITYATSAFPPSNPPHSAVSWTTF